MCACNNSRQILRKRSQGYTLVEITVVVAIIATIAVLAMPTLLNAKKPANEASAISALRSLTTVNEQYRLRFQSYAGSLANLSAEDYIDSVFGAGAKAGFQFTYLANAYSWTCSADPEVPGTTGDRYFFVDQSGVIRFSTTATATIADTPI